MFLSFGTLNGKNKDKGIFSLTLILAVLLSHTKEQAPALKPEKYPYVFTVMI